MPIADRFLVPAFYVDTSAALRVILESGTSPDIEARLIQAEALVTSRLSLVESARAFIRLRQHGSVPSPALADAEQSARALWSRCELWELTPRVCEVAESVAPGRSLRALDALHLATFVLARREFGDLKLLTADQRLQAAAETV